MADRREMFTLLGAALVAAGAGTAQAKLNDAVRGPKENEALHHPFGVQHVYYKGETDQLQFVEAGSLRLNAGESPHPPHKHPEEEILLVTEGRGEISVEGKVTPAAPGTMMYCAAGHYHGIENTGDEPLLFYYFKWMK